MNAGLALNAGQKMKLRVICPQFCKRGNNVLHAVIGKSCSDGKSKLTFSLTKVKLTFTYEVGVCKKNGLAFSVICDVCFLID